MSAGPGRRRAGTTVLLVGALALLLHLAGAADAALIQSGSTPVKPEDALLVHKDSAATTIAGGVGTVSDGAQGPPLDVSISFP